MNTWAFSPHDFHRRAFLQVQPDIRGPGAMRVALAALAVIVAMQLAPSVQAKKPKCKVLHNVMHVNWKKFARKEWLEVLHSRDRFTACLSRAYFPKAGMVHYRKKKGPKAKGERSKHPFKVHQGDIFIYRDEQQFEQLIASDSQTWALIYHCWPDASGAHFVLLVTRKHGCLEGRVVAKAMKALRKTGYKKKISWKRSGCLPQGSGDLGSDNKIYINVTMLPLEIEGTL
ncbi:uncharacterized protein LOC142575519 isoform X1 [Dermacentor variabilis]|uniref:uncharacterized protein LOC142575519 isoform X1 n=2 Tax=Dermacentor variabilis TaxID=34621 RepID=UPI003F5B8608